MNFSMPFSFLPPTSSNYETFLPCMLISSFFGLCEGSELLACTTTFEKIHSNKTPFYTLKKIV
jgi:hypothetical protein